MNPSSFRQIAQKLGLSASTISRAFHQDSRISPQTTRRVMAALKHQEYQLDPVVSAGMSKIRKRSLYRETIAWCGDRPRQNHPWLKPLFESGENYGSQLGYKIEYFHFEKNHPSHLSQLGSIWKARGIRGVVLGPFLPTYQNLSFPWSDFAWVLIGRPFEKPALHSVGRDYQADIRTALQWLGKRGCRRVCFLLNPETRDAIRSATLLASLAHYHAVRPRPRTPCFDLDPHHPECFKEWLKINHPDGLILPHAPDLRLRRLLHPLMDSLPVVFLTQPDKPIRHGQAYFSTRFEVMGQIAVNLMHRLLSNREIGIPSYKQSIVLDSPFFSEIPTE